MNSPKCLLRKTQELLFVEVRNRSFWVPHRDLQFNLDVPICGALPQRGHLVAQDCAPAAVALDDLAG